MRARWVSAVVVTALITGGCGYRGAQSLPLPGGPDEDAGYTVTVEVADASNLVPRETCRTNDVVVGTVVSVTLTEELRARIVCRIRDDVTIPANAQPRLKETSLLGERFLSLDPPAGVSPVRSLRPDAVITSDTTTDPNAETVLAALSQVLNGGSLGSLGTVVRELGTALEGSDFSSASRRLASTLETLASNQRAIDEALDGLDGLFEQLADQRGSIQNALEAIPDGVAALDRQRPELVRTLEELDRLAETAVPLIRESRSATVADLEALTPTLRGLDQARDELALTLERVSTFPFPSNSINAIRNGYAGFRATLLLDLDAVAALLQAALVDPALASVRPEAAAPASTAASPEQASAQRPAPSPDNGASGPADTVRGGLNKLLDGLLGGGSQ